MNRPFPMSTPEGREYKYPIIHSLCTDDNVLFNLLLERNVNLRQPTPLQGKTAFHLAVSHPVGTAYIEQILSSEASNSDDLDKVLDDDGNNILHEASRHSSFVMVKRLLDLPSSPAMSLGKNSHGKTPCDVAREEGKDAIADLLGNYMTRVSLLKSELLKSNHGNTNGSNLKVRNWSSSVASKLSSAPSRQADSPRNSK